MTHTVEDTATRVLNDHFTFRSRQLKRAGEKRDIENEDDFGLSEDYDYEVDDNADKFKTLTDKTLLYFIENYRPDKNNSELVSTVVLNRFAAILRYTTKYLKQYYFLHF